MSLDSCLDCERNQMEGNARYVRWRNASVMVVGCGEHVSQIFEVLRRAQKEIQE